MDRALGFLQCAEQQFAAKPVIVMESTSHYHLFLFQFFLDAGIVQKASRKSSEYGSQKAALLRNCAEQAMRIGIHAPGDSILMRAIITVLRQLIESVHLIDQKIKSLAAQEAYIQKNVTLLQTIPGMGLFSAAVLLSEIGDFSLFRKPKQLAAYFGLDPSERQSGTIQSVRNQISKRGSPYVRSVLYMIAHNTVHSNRFGSVGSPVLAEFYQKKCQCKPPNVAICAVMHKLSNIIFAVLRDQAPFELRAPEIHANMICRKAA